MEWTKQAEETFKSWTGAQKKLWDDWLKAVQGLGKSQPTEVWEKTVESWQESVKNTLDAQIEWTRLWAESLTTAKGTPKEMVEWAQQGQDMIKRWAETQRQVWESWFEVVKKLQPSTLGGNWGLEGQKFFQVWQQAIQKAQDAQAEWVRLWTERQPSKKPGG